MENKPKFEPGKEAGTPFKVTLESSNPFKSGESQYGEWHGYNVSVGGTNMTWFASASVKRILDSSGVKADEEFILELRNIKDSSGNVKKAWYINGKTAWQYEEAVAVEHTKPESINTSDVTPEPVSKPVETSSIEDRVAALEKWREECNADKDGEPIPF